VSENGPREGTRDLPRPGSDAGRRAVDENSQAGIAYGTLSRSLRRRRAELAALMEAGGTTLSAAMAYQADHPLEPAVTPEEIEAAVEAARVKATSTSMKIEDDRRTRARKPSARA